MKKIAFTNKKSLLICFVILTSFTAHQHAISASEQDSSTLKAALFSAVQHRNHEAVHQLLEAGAPVTTSTDTCIVSKLFDIAVEYNDISLAELLIQYGAQFDCEADKWGIPGHEWCSPFAKAIRQNKTEFALRLLDISQTLMEASIEKMRERSLNDSQILSQISVYTNHYLSQVHIACIKALQCKQDGLAHHLLQRHMSPFQGKYSSLIRLKKSKSTPTDWAMVIEEAIQYQCEQSLTWVMDLIGDSIDSPSRDKYGLPDGSPPALRPLLIKCTDINQILVQDPEGDTLLYWAIRRNNLAMAKELLSRGARIRARDFAQADKQGSRSLVHELVSRGADYSENNSWSNYLYTLIGQKSRGELFNHRKTIIQETLEDINDMPRDLSRLICTFAAVPEQQMPSPPDFRSLHQKSYLQQSSQTYQYVFDYLKSWVK